MGRLQRADEAVTALPGSAAAAGLRYAADDRPGIRRRRAGKGFTYIGTNGRPVTDKETLARIRRLAIPPAWTAVWIAPDADAHLQATGRDARGRKQYRYHVRWREVRHATKYDRMIPFARALPQIRRRVSGDLRQMALTKEKVLAAVVQLLERTFIRIGNIEYARTNGSFGLTTLKDGHVRVRGAELRFEFKGKSGVKQSVVLSDARLARIVKRCQDLPGQELFQYVEEGGDRRPITSADVNAYLREIAGSEFTAKDFRTWAGTLLAASSLRAVVEGAADPHPPSARQARTIVTRAVETVARHLGNTAAVCRSCYIHPAILEAYADGTLVQQLARRGHRPRGLSSDEAAVLNLLSARRTFPERLAAAARLARRSRRRGRGRPGSVTRARLTRRRA